MPRILVVFTRAFVARIFVLECPEPVPLGDLVVDGITLRGTALHG
jgi:hypothetical protein